MFRLKTKFLAYATVLLLVVVLASYKLIHRPDTIADKNTVLMKVTIDVNF